MPKARRRTLSHCDINNFLTEISTVADVKPQKIAFDEIISSSTTTIFTSNEEIKQKDEVSLIRDYCKISFQGNNNGNPTKAKSLQSIALSIAEVVDYKLVGSRILNPELFTHPPASIEAKKALILSLAPMLTDAEEQRKKETSECEAFTRCRSSRGRGKSNYEYVDIDTSETIQYADYETRYMNFIYKDKLPVSPKKITTKPHQQTTSSITTTNTITAVRKSLHLSTSHHTTIIPEDNKENQANHQVSSLQLTTATTIAIASAPALPVKKPLPKPTQSVVTATLTLGQPTERKRKHNNPDSVSMNSRRGTLSPTSARAMLLCAAAEEEEAQQQQTAIVAEVLPSKVTEKQVVQLPQEQEQKQENVPSACSQPIISLVLPPAAPATAVDFMNLEDFSSMPLLTTGNVNANNNEVGFNMDDVDLLGLNYSATPVFPDTIHVLDHWMSTSTPIDFTTIQTIESRLSLSQQKQKNHQPLSPLASSSSMKVQEQAQEAKEKVVEVAEEDELQSSIGLNDLDFLDTMEMAFADPVITSSKSISTRGGRGNKRTKPSASSHNSDKPRRESFSYDAILEWSSSLEQPDNDVYGALLTDTDDANDATATNATANATANATGNNMAFVDVDWAMGLTSVTTATTIAAVVAPTVPTVVPSSSIDMPSKLDLQEYQAKAQARKLQRLQQVELQYTWELIGCEVVNKAIDRMLQLQQKQVSQ